MTLLTIGARGWLIVSLTAMNVGAVAGHHWALAFAGGFAISWVWWENSRGAARSTEQWARESYAAGAALGTVTGMWIVRVLYG